MRECQLCARGEKEGRTTIALEVGGEVKGRVDGELAVVSTETVTVCVRVGKQARLEDRVGRGLDSRDQVRRGEGDLLDLAADGCQRPFLGHM